jgi:iron complex outermembrane receptor protein
MRKSEPRRARLMSGAAAVALLLPTLANAQAANFNIAAQPLTSALKEFGLQSQFTVVAQPDVVARKATLGVSQSAEPEVALTALLAGTGLSYRRESDTFLIVQAGEGGSPQSGSAAGGGAEVEGLIVTAQKREENIQDVPIAMSAFSQETLENRQVAGGPDLITQIPNMSFTKTNFSSYSIQIRGIGTQAISATTDPAVAVAFNNTPFIRNRFFEQEFYDLERLEVLRGPQGTLYGRNATAGVVNLISAKPKFSYQAKASADVANYSSMRLEGMVNIPLAEDVVALRLAGAWTKREGFAFNQMTGQQIDGRDLWSTRVSLRFEPTPWISANLIWEHFQEDDDRLRSGKQLCKKHVVDQIGTLPVPVSGGGVFSPNTYVSQGCEAVSLYSPEAFQTPNGYALPFYGPTGNLTNPVFTGLDPYRSATQSRNLRVIESSVEPDYRANVDIAELQLSLDLTPALSLSSETAYSTDFLFSVQDYNRFTTTPHAFNANSGFSIRAGLLDSDGVFCDPQLGCSDRLLLVDLSTEESSQFSQELRLASDFEGPFNFSFGANYLRHDAEAKYYVFINTLTMFAANGAQNFDPGPYVAGVTDNSSCQGGPGAVGETAPAVDPTESYGFDGGSCIYIDPNPLDSLNDQGRNYFLSRNPYKLISYATFGELYYQIADNLKITAGLRWTVDRKEAPQIPSWLLASTGAGAVVQPTVAGPYPVALVVNQEWREPTGRLALDWKPDLGFTDETMLYASYAHGYKAGGANPPPPVLVTYGDASGADIVPEELVPQSFSPEFVDAFEMGAKNILLDGALTLNLTGFYYDYKGYQVSEIRNRTAVNSNFDAEVWGAEVEADWRITETLRVGFKGGYNGTRMADGSSAVDLMDRTAGRDDWIVIRPFPTIPSNCVIPVFVATAGGAFHVQTSFHNISATGVCVDAYTFNLDPVTGRPYVANPYATNPNNVAVAPLTAAYANYPGWNPATAPNGGQGFSKDLSGNELPNAPRYTTTLTADYVVPLRGEWLLNLHGDYHYQAQSWGRVINSDPYDRIEAFSTVNLAGTFTNENAGWKVMAYIKNVFDETAITGTFLNSDDTGLTTNVFLTEPRLYGIRVTKEWTGGDGFWLRREAGGEPYLLSVEIGGGTNQFSADASNYSPDWLDEYSPTFPLPAIQNEDLDWGDTRSVRVTYAPLRAWKASATYRIGKSNGHSAGAGYEAVGGGYSNSVCIPVITPCAEPIFRNYASSPDNHWRGAVQDTEEHAIADFMAGKELGIGSFGARGFSMLSAGVRYAKLKSTSLVKTDGIPDRYVPMDFEVFDTSLTNLPRISSTRYSTTLDSKRSFGGWGPSVSWDTSLRLWGDDAQGHADLDWSVAGGVLFGKQDVDNAEKRWAELRVGGLPREGRGDRGTRTITSLYDDVVPTSRTEDVTVPNVSLTLGVSYTIDRVKVSTGYSYDRFFDVIDGGIDEAQTFDRTIHGPYLKLSLGFGG